MLKYSIPALALAVQGISADAACKYQPRMILYSEPNPKLHQVPARPNMDRPFTMPPTTRSLEKTIDDLSLRVERALNKYDPKLPRFIAREKINVAMRLLFQDGEDILNFLYNTPDEPCIPAPEGKPGQAVTISNSQVTVNYVNAAQPADQALRHVQKTYSVYPSSSTHSSHGQGYPVKEYKPTPDYDGHRYNALDYSHNNGTAYDVKKPIPIPDEKYSGSNYYTADYPYYSQYNTSDYTSAGDYPYYSQYNSTADYPYYGSDSTSGYDSTDNYSQYNSTDGYPYYSQDNTPYYTPTEDYPYYDQYNYTDGYPYYSQYNSSDYFRSPNSYPYDHNNSTEAYSYYSQDNSSNYNSTDDYSYYGQYNSTDAYPYYSHYSSSDYNSTDDYPYHEQYNSTDAYPYSQYNSSAYDSTDNYDQYNSTDAYPHYNSTREQNSIDYNSTLDRYTMVYDPVNSSSTDSNTTAERYYESGQNDTKTPRQHSAEVQRSISTNEIPDYVPFDLDYPSYNESDSDVFTNPQYRYEL